MIPPLMNRLVIFKSCNMLHSVKPSWAERYCLTIWIDADDINLPKDVQLNLASSSLDTENIVKTISFLRNSPVQRCLSRAVYMEEYAISLLACMENAPGCEEMMTGHDNHIKHVNDNIPLANMVKKLRTWRTENSLGWTEPEKLYDSSKSSCP